MGYPLTIIGTVCLLASSSLAQPVGNVPEPEQVCVPGITEVVNFDNASQPSTLLRFDNFDITPPAATVDFKGATSTHTNIAVSREGTVGDPMAGRFFTAGDYDFKLNAMTIAGGAVEVGHFIAPAIIECYGSGFNQLEKIGKEKVMSISPGFNRIDFTTTEEDRATFGKCRSIKVTVNTWSKQSSVYALDEVSVTKLDCHWS